MAALVVLNKYEAIPMSYFTSGSCCDVSKQWTEWRTKGKQLPAQLKSASIQKILLITFLISKNEQETSHKRYTRKMVFWQVNVFYSLHSCKKTSTPKKKHLVSNWFSQPFRLCLRICIHYPVNIQYHRLRILFKDQRSPSSKQYRPNCLSRAW